MMKSNTVFLLVSTIVVTFATSVDASCDYLSGAPIIETVIPTFQHTLKFLNVDATVYRNTLAEGSTPRLRILRYSSNPIVDVDNETKEIRISAEGDKCAPGPGGAGGSATSSGALNCKTSPLLLSSLMLAVMPSKFRGVGAFAALCMGLLARTANAADEDCTPAMQVVLEAPPYYLGSVEECLLESTIPDHCPEPFPTFPTCSDPNPTCKLAVIGAGTGGLYTAMRLMETDKYEASDICIFEATDRVGGRVYSLRGFGPDNDITVDAGAYRTWPEFTVRFVCGNSFPSRINLTPFAFPFICHSPHSMLLLPKSLDSMSSVMMATSLVKCTILLETLAKRLALLPLSKRWPGFSLKRALACTLATN